MLSCRKQSPYIYSLLVATFVLATLPLATAQAVEKAIYTFMAGTDGGFPFSGVVFDSAGNLYGTSPGGGTSGACGSNGCGMVYKLAPNGSGGWTQTILYSFKGGSDGEEPIGGVVLDAAGNIFGTTAGQNNTCTPAGSCGTVFELRPNGDGTYSETTLYRFTGGADGNGPEASLVLDSKGNLYGSTVFGGVTTCTESVGCGVVFQLHPNTDGTWTEKILHRFAGGNNDGAFLSAALVLDARENLYGVTTAGGGTGCTGFGCGTAFRLDRAHGWHESHLHRFTGGSDGSIPEGIVFDGVSKFYGTTLLGGDTTCFSPGEPLSGCGSVYQFTSSAGTWTKTTLYNFATGSDAQLPQSAPTIDSGGNLFGLSTVGGGTSCLSGAGCGAIFELTPGTSWSESVLYRFSGGTDGNNGYFSGVVLDSAGNLYGTTTYGGDLNCAGNPGFGCGTVFEWSPQ